MLSSDETDDTLGKVREMNGDGERYKNDLIRTRVEAR